MTYVKWARNAKPTDWTTRLILKDGTEVVQGVPVQLDAETRKRLEAEGRVFEDSSAAEAKEETAAPVQPIGSDVAGTSPVFSAEDDQNDNPAHKRDNK